ncbi:MAG TPA: histidine kinase, partial [Roseiflexaceae bacterium]|nr:histidine kinase [Roseiflexaceae bacterium]
MSISLARWLTDNRDALLPRWMAILHDHTHAAHGNGVAAKSDDLDHHVAHPDERSVLLASIYDGLICAADQNYEPLNDCLRLLRALRTHPGEDELPRQLALASQLRRAAWGLLFQDGQLPRSKRDAPDWSRLVDELDQLLEYTSVTMAEQWVAAAAVVQRELNETKLLVESLYHDAEATDRTTLQVSNLNQIAQGISASMDRAQQLEIVGEKLKDALEIASLSIWLIEA